MNNEFPFNVSDEQSIQIEEWLAKENLKAVNLFIQDLLKRNWDKYSQAKGYLETTWEVNTEQLTGKDFDTNKESS